MKTLFNTLVIAILVNFVSYSQNNMSQDSMKLIVSNYLKTIESTPKYADHSHLSEKFLELILTEQDDKILEIVHTQGFNNFDKIIYLNHYPILSTIILSDSLILNELNEIRSIFPKGKSIKPTSIISEEIASDILTKSTWMFIGKNAITYKVIAFFTNDQITTIGYNTFK